MIVGFTLNGSPQRCDVPAHWTLLRMLRDAAGRTDAKHGCGEGVCGACAVLLDGVAVNSCSVLDNEIAVLAASAYIDVRSLDAVAVDVLDPLFRSACPR